ncbi:MAG: pyroglutamyl-peptidase I, partial [Limnochordia bacterium]|nr:pyroglutamyl-peptidase I [Limnochordia bacterium]
PDNRNNQPVDVPIVAGAPAAYFSTLPIRAIMEKLHQAGIPSSISNSAGTYVCNHTMYGILHHIAVNELPTMAGFVHIPYLPAQAVQHQGAPSMGLADMVRAIRIVIETCISSTSV